MLGLFERLGIASAVNPKLKQVPSVRLVGSAIASGEVDLGFQQTNELSHYPGVDYIGPLPPALQEPTRRSGAIMAGSRAIEEAEALLKFLSGPETASTIRKHGLEPP